jgi:hypothetical protein
MARKHATRRTAKTSKKPRKAPRPPQRTPRTPRRTSSQITDDSHPLTAEQTAHMRQLFWENVIREILSSLSMVAVLRPAEPSKHAPEHAASDLPIIDAQTDSPNLPQPHQQALERAPGPHFEPELFDGRLAVVLKSGERVAIGDVFPVFACSIAQDLNRPLAMAVECSVFQIRTPEGQVFTIPLHEIRAFHALTPELMRRLMEAARQQNMRGNHVPEHIPFGFAAYTSLAQGKEIQIPEAPTHPIE